MTDFDQALDELAAIQQQVSDALARAAELAAEAKTALPPELLAQIKDTPVETILRDLITANEEQATKDRAQIARLVVLLDRLNLKVDGLETAANGVADDLAAAQGRADAVEGEPGAAADAGMKSP